MKIDHTAKSLISGPIADDKNKLTKKSSFEAGAPTESSVKISSVSAHFRSIEQGFADTPVVDAARVAELKQAISDGHFKVNAENVADRLLATVRDLIVAHKA
ncbi:MAG: flagellar biosynthesis anti-sigma factor FlgM [Betaproteobacteria bacterium]|nr:flagellar biosynthesis anti-sigma factor FlgM [Betaproteobacteria bacterium]